MAEELKGNKKTDEILTEVVPTLFIALGGTGAEVLWRIRRRILNTLWGAGTGQPVRLESLTEFPFAEFLQIDLNFDTVTQSGTATKTDILGDKIRFKEEERLVKKLALSTYIKTDDDLAKYPMVQEWFPLSRSKVNELNIDTGKGAGQIRAISRLYFFDKYAEIKSAIRTKAKHLQATVQIDAAAKRLGLTMQKGALKIVVVASTAGGTGSGSFLDLGYLSGILGAQEATAGVTTNLVLMLPTGYAGANRTRTQANTYAALMELETCMRQGSRYINGWNENEIIRDMPDTPYDDIYLIDTCNLAGAQTEDIKDVYDMVADALFEDFSTAEFANMKRSISVNQNLHKTSPYSSLVDRKTYGDMKLTFSRGYSSFGQATIDTHLEQKQNIVLFRQVNGMLKAFFGVSSEDTKNNTPTEGERDDLLANRMQLGVDNETLDYDFIARTDLYRKGAERTTYPMVTELLRVNGISRLDDIEKNITDTFEDIRVGGNYKEWASKIAEAITRINHDTFKAVESGSGLHEDAIKKRRSELLDELTDPDRENGLIKALWARVDNKERGGLDYTIELIQRLKDRLENANTGLVKVLEENAKWFSDLSGHLRNEETTILQEHLQQAIGKFIGGKEQSEAKLKQISNAVRLYVRYHLYAAASGEAAVLVHELSDALGKKQGTDSDGNPIWGGFIGELEAGRGMVRAIINDAEDQIARTTEAMKQGHAMYFVLPAPRSKIDDLEDLPPKQAREWAEQAFHDFGGTQELFDMLKHDEGRAELLGKLRNRALALIGNESQQDEINPLFAALDAHPNQGQLFSDFLQRAMPWVPAKLDKYLKESDPNDQYKCLIGVKNSKEFEARYGAELRSRVPTVTMMTFKEVGFVEIDAPGKVVCYVELSGLPLPSLKALDDWYTAYREETPKIPVLTHKFAGTFVHPRELTTDELASRAEDFKLFVEAVALGVLTRGVNGEDAGVLKLSHKGSTSNVGNEKKLRMDGFPASFRPFIQQQVNLDLEELKTDDQLALWVALMEYYRDLVYPLLVRQVDMVSVKQKSLPTLLCENLVNEWTGRLQSKVGGETQAEHLLRAAREARIKWTEELPGSTADVYQYEVNIQALQPKRVLKRDVLQAGWTLGGVQQVTPAAAPMFVPPPMPGMPPPLLELAYFVAVNSQPTGPHNAAMLQQLVASRHLTPQTKVWKAGMADWQEASLVPELQSLFVVPPPLGAVAPPPLA
ncbi:MAG: tubulin-like doman-containing protein [Sulfuricella sp.]